MAFVANIPFYGFAALCIDHPEVQAIIPKVLDRRVVTYGFSPQAGVRGINLEPTADGIRLDVEITDRRTERSRTVEDVFLPMFGRHNALNALAAIAIANEMDIADDVLRQGLAEFEGVNRRFTRAGEVDGITVIDDYGHHPVEIAAVLAAARTATQGRIIAVVQPHRYTRLRDLFEDFCSCFNDADVVVVADVYPAGEDPIEGISRDALVDGLRAHGHRQAMPLSDPQELAANVNGIARSGDMVVCLGAGSVTQWAHALPAELARLRHDRNGGGR